MHKIARSDFFLSRRGSVAAIAREVVHVLEECGYSVVSQDYDIPLTANFVEAMHEAIKNSRDLIVLFTADYETRPYTRMEFTSFVADQANSEEDRRVVILRCEDVPLRGLFAPAVFQSLVGVDDPRERKRRIVAAIKGESQAKKPPPRPFVGVPPPIMNFTGRADELERLDAILMGGDKPAAITQASAYVGLAALKGLGGVGKTSLATEYAYRYRSLYAGVWWCPAESRSGLITSLASLARHLGAVAADEADLEKAARAGLSRLSEQRAVHLLVYDNVTSPEDIAALLPASGARVLITSRFADWRDKAVEVELEVLPPDDAVKFLEDRADRRDAAGAHTLAEALGRLPLALDHAAAYCRRTQMRFADYATKAASLITTAPRGATYPTSVAATFNLAINAAVEIVPAARLLMAYIGFCAPERIPMSLLEGAIADEFKRLEALLALVDSSLIRPHPFEDGTEAWTVHRLVHAVARSQLDNAGALQNLRARLMTLFPQERADDRDSWSRNEQLIPHLVECCRAQPESEVGIAEVAELLSRAGNHYAGRWDNRAQLFYEPALEIREKVLGPEHSDTAKSLTELALALEYQNKLADAHPLLKRALAINEKVLGLEHPDTAEALVNLAVLIGKQGDYATACTLHERALAIRDKVLGPQHIDIANSLYHVAMMLQRQGHLAAATPIRERALAMCEKVLGPWNVDLTWFLENLAGVLLQQGDLAAARSLYQHALAVYDKNREWVRTFDCIDRLARVAREQGDLPAARSLYERLLSGYLANVTSWEAVECLNNLIGVLRKQGDLAAAQSHHERVVAIKQELLENGDRDL